MTSRRREPSKQNLQSKLQLPRSARHRARDDAELPRAQNRIWKIELDAVENIESLRPKLQRHALHGLEVLEQRKIVVGDPRSAHVRKSPAGGPERKRSRLGEDGSIEVLREPGLRARTARLGALAVVVRPQEERRPELEVSAVERAKGIQIWKVVIPLICPSPNGSIRARFQSGPSVGPFPTRKLVDVTEHQNPRHILRRYCAFRAAGRNNPA